MPAGILPENSGQRLSGKNFTLRFRNNSAGRERAERAGLRGFCRKIPVNDYPEKISGPVPE
jgi:hypothetical protein